MHNSNFHFVFYNVFNAYSSFYVNYLKMSKYITSRGNFAQFISLNFKILNSFILVSIYLRFLLFT